MIKLGYDKLVFHLPCRQAAPLACCLLCVFKKRGGATSIIAAAVPADLFLTFFYACIYLGLGYKDTQTHLYAFIFSS